MHRPLTTTNRARLRDWQRHHLRIVVNVAYFALLIVCLFPVFGKSLLPDEWRASGVLGGLLAGIAGNLLASHIQSWKDKNNPPPPGRDAWTAARYRYLTGLRSYCQSLPLAA